MVIETSADRSTMESRERERESADVCWEYRGTRAVSLLTHLEEFANVTSGDLWCKSMARRTVAQGDSQVCVSRCPKRFEDIFDREKQPGQRRAVVQQEESGRVAEEGHTSLSPCSSGARTRTTTTCDDPGTHCKFHHSHLSSSHEYPMQVNTTPRRARIPKKDGDDTTTVSPTFGHECIDQWHV